MKRIMIVAALVMLMLSTGCTRATTYGACIGVNSKGNPQLEYEYSGWNVAMGIIFVETLVVPLVVVFDDLRCPVGPKQ